MSSDLPFTCAVLVLLFVYALSLSWNPPTSGKKYVRQVIMLVCLWFGGFITAYVAFRVAFSMRRPELGVLFALIPAFMIVTSIMGLSDLVKARTAWHKDQQTRQSKIEEIKKKALSDESDDEKK